MSHAFLTDAASRSERRNRLWYQKNLVKVLQAAKEKQVREIDASIVLAEELMRVWYGIFYHLEIYYIETDEAYCSFY